MGIGATSALAERVGFEPTVRMTYNGFRDRPDRPLRHLSSSRGGRLIGGGHRDRNRRDAREAIHRHEA